MKKILLVTNGLRPGGVEVTVKQLALLLRAAGDEVMVCALARRGAVAEELEEEGIKVICPEITSPFCFNGISRLIKLLRDFRPDIVHAHLFAAEVLSWWALCRSRIKTKFIVSKYETGYWMRWYHRLLEKKIRSLAETVICDSMALLPLLQARGYTAKQLTVALPLVEKKILDAAGCTSGARGNLQFLHLARFEAVKGHRVLVAAVAQVAAELPDLNVSMVGDGEEKQGVIGFVAELRLSEKITFSGFRRDTVELLRQCSALLLPSLSETTPLVLLEAMALGTPIIASRLPGITAILDDGKEALLVEPGDAASLAAALLRLGREPELGPKLAAAAYQRWQREFHPDRQWEEIKKAYERI